MHVGDLLTALMHVRCSTRVLIPIDGLLFVSIYLMYYVKHTNDENHAFKCLKIQ